MSFRYEDIVELECPVSTRHKPMAREERAKQFSPFAALKGHTEAIAAEERIFSHRRRLSEDQKKVLDQKFHEIEERYTLGEHPEVELERFLPVIDDDNGYLQTMKGIVRKLDPDGRILDMDGQKIPIDDIERIISVL